MKFIKFVIPFFLFGSFAQKNEDPLRNYFWKINDYETPKVNVYTHLIDGDDAGKLYYLMEKTKKNKLLVKKYNNEFELTMIFEDTYKKGGVYITKAEVLEHQSFKEMTAFKIKQGFIFPFQEPNQELVIDIEMDSKLEAFDKIESHTSWNFISGQGMDTNEGLKDTILATGNSNYTFYYSNGNKEVVKEKIDTWYIRNIGVTKVHQKCSYWDLTETYLETISQQEFEKLKIDFLSKE
jgi:hypothetical protein